MSCLYPLIKKISSIKSSKDYAKEEALKSQWFKELSALSSVHIRTEAFEYEQ